MQAADPAADSVPVLPSGVRLHHCRIRQHWFLLAPERAIKLDPVGVHVLQAVDGIRDFAGLVTHLASQFKAPEEQIAKDVRDLLQGLRARRMLEYT